MTFTNCITDPKYKLNQDGYLRRRYKKTLVMWHRHVWIQKYGPLEEHQEIHHLCHNRACFNTEHLEVIDGSLHASKTNTERYSKLKEKAKEYWEQYRCSGTELAQQFNRTASTGCRWVREFKRNASESL